MPVKAGFGTAPHPPHELVIYKDITFTKILGLKAGSYKVLSKDTLLEKWHFHTEFQTDFTFQTDFGRN